jgi:aromatic-L-amino-acid/L-tryptophan decarboxylase
MKNLDVRTDRSAPIDMTAAEFRTAGHKLVDRIAGWLDEMPQGPLTHDESPADLRRLLDADRPLPESGTDAAGLLDRTTDLLFEHSLFNGHPRFFGYITSSPAPIGALADLLAAAINQNVGSWQLSPMATVIEAQTVRWIAELVGYPTDTGGLLVSGGNMANFVGFLAARTAAAKTVRATGLRSLAPMYVYVSADTHTWIQKATDLFGLGTDAIRWIPTDASHRMKTAELDARIADDRKSGGVPLLVVGTAGAVATGAVDPLAEIAAICRRHDVWFHVDGAYGAVAARVPGVPADLTTIAEADSVAVDPHKWLYTPLEAGCVLVKRRQALLDAFSYHPTYYHFDQEVTNYFEQGLQNSRGFRALKVWLALQQVGRTGYETMIGDDILLSRDLHTRVQSHPDLEAFTQHLSITTFRYRPRRFRSDEALPEAGFLDRLNQQLLTRLERSGDAFLSSAVIDGHFALRACIVNFRTSARDIEALVSLVVRLGGETDAEMAGSAVVDDASSGR